MLNIRILFFMSLLFVSADSYAANQNYWQVADENIELSDNLYFTWLGCDSCLMIEEQVDLSGFQVMPLIARADWRPAAKIQVAIELLNIDTDTISRFKQAVLDKKIDVENLSAMTTALIELGVDQGQLEQKLTSTELFSAIQSAVDKAKQYKVRYAPTVIIKGQYATDAKSNGSIAVFYQTVNLLKNK